MLSKNNPGRTYKLLDAAWRNWAVGVGAITLPLLMALFVPKIWVAFLCFIEGYLLISMMRGELTSGVSSCSLIVRLASRVLLVTSAAMFIVVILCTDWLVPKVIYLDLYNAEIPFVTCLVVFPVTALMCALTLYCGMGQRYSRECQRRNGYYAGDTVLATFYYRESKYQILVLMVVSLLLGAVEYWYYFARYINSDLNTPDRFFFNYMPIVMYLLSLIFMRGRYTSMQVMYQAFEASQPGMFNCTIVRFLVFCGDDLLLRNGDDGRWDTPAQCRIGRCRAVSEPHALEMLAQTTGIHNPELRYCFTNEGIGEGSNVIHYAAFIKEEDRHAVPEGDIWFNAYMIDSAMAGNALAPALANELYRIHTMTMAWKTYDRDGRRLYPIKHYRPTFRLRDLREWTLDYDDQHWFDIAHNNEDRLFFRTRRLWTRLTDVLRSKQQTADE